MICTKVQILKSLGMYLQKHDSFMAVRFSDILEIYFLTLSYILSLLFRGHLQNIILLISKYLNLENDVKLIFSPCNKPKNAFLSLCSWSVDMYCIIHRTQKIRSGAENCNP